MQKKVFALTLFAALILAVVPTASAAVSETRSCSSFSNQGSVAWANPSNVAISDNVRATVTLNNTNSLSGTLLFSNCGFTIPTDATVTGIKLEIEKGRGLTNLGASVHDLNVNIFSGTDDKASATAWPSADTYVSYGGSSDLWGGTFTPADINSSSFGGSFQIQHSDLGCDDPAICSIQARADHVRLTVTYSTSGSSSALPRNNLRDAALEHYGITSFLISFVTLITGAHFLLLHS